MQRIRVSFKRARAAVLAGTFAAAVLFVVPTTAVAQGYPFSQRGTVSQHIALSEVTIEYGRPVARGRALFGALVPWDSIWHPGADDATRITFNHDVLLDGHPLKAGTYSLWLIPREKAPWTFIVSRVFEVSHKDYAGPGQDALRLEIATEAQSHMESMAWYFPMVQRDESILRFHWGETSLNVRIKAPYKPE